jgi:hypothetical protein
MFFQFLKRKKIENTHKKKMQRMPMYPRPPQGQFPQQQQMRGAYGPQYGPQNGPHNNPQGFNQQQYMPQYGQQYGQPQYGQQQYGQPNYGPQYGPQYGQQHRSPPPQMRQQQQMMMQQQGPPPPPPSQHMCQKRGTEVTVEKSETVTPELTANINNMYIAGGNWRYPSIYDRGYVNGGCGMPFPVVCQICFLPGCMGNCQMWNPNPMCNTCGIFGCGGGCMYPINLPPCVYCGILGCNGGCYPFFGINAYQSIALPLPSGGCGLMQPLTDTEKITVDVAKNEVTGQAIPKKMTYKI